MSKILFTIGHSNQTIEQFIELVKHYQITAIADVRSHPYSRYLPHFNRDLLKFELLKHSIKYVFLGEELGARPKDLSCYINGKVAFAKVADSEFFQAGIDRIIKGINDYTIALMCAEKDPISCHRTILICKYLRQSKIEIKHVIDRDTVEDHAQLEERLLTLSGFDVKTNRLKIPEILQLDLFQASPVANQQTPVSKEEYLEQAYLNQGRKIAYKN